MGRPRSFDTAAATAAAAEVFCHLGYEGTSIDDLVSATGVHRGSLYSAFGSKRGIFLAALQNLVDQLPASSAHPSRAHDPLSGDRLDLLLVACLELAPRDDAARDLVTAASSLLAVGASEDADGGPAALLGRRLLDRARVPATPPPGPSPLTADRLEGAST